MREKEKSGCVAGKNRIHVLLSFAEKKEKKKKKKKKKRKKKKITESRTKQRDVITTPCIS